MRLQSLRQDSSNPRKLAANRRRLAVVVALLTPTVAWSDDGKSPHAALAPARPAAESAQQSGFRPVPATELVPLSPEQSGHYGNSMSLIGPVSRSAGQPTEALREQTVEDDDPWQPRGTRLDPRASPSQPPQHGEPGQRSAQPSPFGGRFQSTFQILPSQASPLPPSPLRPDSSVNKTQPDRLSANASTAQDPGDVDAEDAQGVLTVTDPEQNEPTDFAALDAGDGDNRGAVGSGESLDESVNPQLAEDNQQRRVEIRRLRLKEQVQGDHASASITARRAGSRSAARMTVGDTPLEEAELEEADRDLTPAARPPVPVATDHPIQGDRITAAGELILASGKSASGLPVLPQTAQLKTTIESGLRYYWDRPEDAAERTHWGMMHSIMVFDKDTQIINRRQRFNAVAWMAGNNPCRNQMLFSRDQQGIVVRTGVGLQGHQAQLLAIFGLVNVPLNYPVYAARQKFSVADILEREKLDCKSGNELTFTLIALAHYADSDTAWVAADGQKWDVQRVIREELSQPIVGAACGGTHRLMGFAHALRRRRAEDKPITHQWDRADRYVKEFVEYTWTLQNRDGSMSTAWFERPEDNGNIDRKIQTTGHMLEFLLTTVPDSELQSPQMLRTVGYLANTLYAERGHQWQIGPKGHALRALAMYHQRVFGDSAPWRGASEGRSASGPPSQRSVR